MDYAIIEIGGGQQRVSPGDTIRVNRLPSTETGASIAIDRVLLVRSKKTLVVGTPTVEGATVKATVVSETKGKKVIVFKKKRTKQYRRTKGPRALHTTLRIDAIQTGK
jgi:large subunit ribosomal protein L21